MKKTIYVFIIIILLSGCFDPPDITAPMFIPKSPPDSLTETGIDAHPDNAIYLEWEEPATAEEEGILSYYIYRGTVSDGEFKFKYIDEVFRNSGVIKESDSYVDDDVTFDSTYYYYLKSHNDFTNSRTTSDTVSYKLAHKAVLYEPVGEISDTKPRFYFVYHNSAVNRISYFYFRLYKLKDLKYQINYFTKTHRFDLSQGGFNVYLNNTDLHTTVLLDSLSIDDYGKKYLESGSYRWRIDAVSGELAGAPESEGSESEWKYFTVK